MPALEILQDFGQQAGGGFAIECENAVDDMVGACLVGRVEIPRFGCRLERAHDHPCGLGRR